jgi:hypothetical protein
VDLGGAGGGEISCMHGVVEALSWLMVVAVGDGGLQGMAIRSHLFIDHPGPLGVPAMATQVPTSPYSAPQPVSPGLDTP